MTQEKPEKRTRVKSYFNSNQAVVSAVRSQAELTQHRILKGNESRSISLPNTAY